jgi:glyceraldehyde-3-phosphate dehydrogenase (NADP+)
VHEDIQEEFIKQYNEKLKTIKMGMPYEDVMITPLPEHDKPQYLKDLIDDAVAKGAKIMNNGGGTIEGSFVYPTVLYPVNSDMRIYNEEQFGPVVPITSFKNIEEILQK